MIELAARSNKDQPSLKFSSNGIILVLKILALYLCNQEVNYFTIFLLFKLLIVNFLETPPHLTPPVLLSQNLGLGLQQMLYHPYTYRPGVRDE